MQVTMFLMLGVQVFPAGLVLITWAGLPISLFLIFVAPASVHTALAFSPISLRERLLLPGHGSVGHRRLFLLYFT
jgi:potassium/hydrogen antiporter